jgi:Uma2 family endonuclease
MPHTSLTTLKWTVDDYHRLVDGGILDDKHVELLNGEIVEMSPEGIPHADLSDEAAGYLRGLLGDRAKVREGKPITLADRSEPEPDLCICRNMRYNAHHPYPEDIFFVIEYSDSSLDKDLSVKSVIYAQANIQEYWVVNLRNKEVVVLRSPSNGRYQERQIFSNGNLAPVAFSDVSVGVEQLLG